MQQSPSATLDGEWALSLCACQEVWERSLAQALYTAAIPLNGCVQGVGTRVARVGRMDYTLSHPSTLTPPTHTVVHFGDVQNSIRCKCLNCTTILAVRLH